MFEDELALDAEEADDAFECAASPAPSPPSCEATLAYRSFEADDAEEDAELADDFADARASRFACAL